MKKIFKFILKLVVLVIIVAVVFVLSYVGYVALQYYRIEHLQNLTIEDNKESFLDADGSYSVITYNIGFGAYNHEFSFFMDSGVMLDGSKVAGTKSKAVSREVVLTNTTGAINTVSGYNADFLLFQEVDSKSTRSFGVNQLEMLKDLGDNYSLTHAINFHSAYLMYPLNDFHGRVNSGITSLSKYNITEAVRYSFPVDESFPNKFFDLDRCFMLMRFPLDNDKELVLINLHMSAYDKGGIIRAAQLKMLNETLAEEYAKGNYVIAGGDYNHDIANSINQFPTQQEVPEWVFVLDESDLAEGFSFAASTNAPTCRSTDMPYTEGVNYTVIIDGFIVSDNVNVIMVETIDNDFLYSDHNPVILEFSFN